MVDWFGVGSFMKLADSEALNNSRFIQAQSGLRMGTAAMHVAGTLGCPLTIDLVKLPKRQFFPGLLASSYFSPAMAAMRAERFGEARVVSGGPVLKATQEEWHAYDKASQKVTKGLSSTQAFQAARGGSGVALPAAAQAVTLQGVF